MIQGKEKRRDERPPDAAIVVFNVERLQILLTQRLQEQSISTWCLPCTPITSSEDQRNLEALHCALNAETDGEARILRIECLGTFFHGCHPEEIQLVYLACMEVDTPRDGSVWWKIEALPELAYDHASIVMYAMKTLWSRLASTQNGLALLPKTMTLRDVGHLLAALEQMIRPNGDGVEGWL